MVILLQGAMMEEIDVFMNFYKPNHIKNINGFEFFISNYKDSQIIISLTQKGIINTSIATTIAISNFSPDIVINQGCAGGHTLNTNIGDIIIGEKTVYINDFKTLNKSQGEGSNSLTWIPNPKRSYEILSTPELVLLSQQISHNKKVMVGTLGSGDLHSKEYDRIIYLNNLFKEDSEDMESVAALKTCENFGTKKIALRIISNNELLNQKFDISVCKELQKFTIKLVDKIINLKE